MQDLISRQSAIELVRDVCDAIMSGCESWYDPEIENEVYKDTREVDAILKCKKEVRIALRNMPSAQPETKQGEWIPHSEMYTFPGTELTSSGGVICSSCGFRTHNRMHKLIGCPYNYCPICGTAMRKKNKNG